MGGKRRIYLDHNASSPVRPAAADAVVRGLSLSGNPSSIHGEGRAARAFLEAARSQVAEAVGARARDVVFTSGATEGLNALLRPALLPATGPERLTHLFLGATEHAAVRDGHDFGAEWTQTIPVDGNGLIDCAALDAQLAAVRGGGVFAAVLVAIQAANNETGVLQPLDAIARIVNAHGAVLAVDAVQIIGKLPFDLTATGIAAIVLSAHKFGGPKGVGAIVLNGDRVRLERPLIAGGGQETRRRSGT
ncbi:MAG: cysteine desulfurase family protein, partial [Beijerinckiaceae bacterium]